MKRIFFGLILLLSFSVHGKTGTVFLSATLSEETDKIGLSFLSNSPMKISGKKIVLRWKKETKEIPLAYELGPFQDRTYEIPRPKFLKIEDLSFWRIGTDDAVVRPTTLSFKPRQANTTLPAGWEVRGEELLIPSGTHILRKGLTLDRSLTVRTRAGVVLILGEDVSVFLRGRFDLEDLKIVSLDKLKPWKSVVLHNYGEESSLKNVSVEGGASGTIGETNNTCALCIYGGKVRVENLSVSDSLAEDGLNAKDVSLKMIGGGFKNMASDAFDCDFCSLEVSGTYFQDISGDAIDVSTTKARIQGSHFQRIKDKAISVGEGSSTMITNNKLREASIGIAVKDASKAEIIENTFHQCELNLALYRKKAFWIQGGTATLKGNQWDKDKRKLDEYSSLSP